MIEKIISTGLPGIAAAALDVAIKLGLEYGGWRRDEQPVPPKYQLARLTETDRRSVAERCVADSDGVLFFLRPDSRPLALEAIRKLALQLNKPLMIQTLSDEGAFSASRSIAAWIAGNHIKTMYVDGETTGVDNDSAGVSVAKILEATFFLSMVDTGITSPLSSVVQRERFPMPENPPGTLEDALNHLEKRLSLKDRATIANMVLDELPSLQFTLGSYINGNFDLFRANADLLRDCQRSSGRIVLAPEDAAAVIIRALWERLQTTCRIRIVK